MKVDLEVLRDWLAEHGFDVNRVREANIVIGPEREAVLTAIVLSDEHHALSDMPIYDYREASLKSWPCEHKEPANG